MGDAENAAISRTRCSEIMTKNVVTASSAATLREVSAMMRDGDMGTVPVVDAGRLVGLVTDRDIVVRAVAEGRSPDSPIDGVMTSEIYTVAPDDFVIQAVRLMGDKQVRRVPVTNADGTLAGIIALADVALGTEDEREIAETIEEISSGASFWGRT